MLTFRNLYVYARYKTSPVIVVSDMFRHCIKVLDITGRLVHTYGCEGKQGPGDGELYNPCDVCTDEGGHLYVCDMDNNRVVSFWQDCGLEKYEEILSTDQLDRRLKPSYVCYSSKERRLFIGYENNVLCTFKA